MFEALCEALGAKPRLLTKTERAKFNTAAQQLRDVDATPGEIADRAAEYVRRYGTARLTAMALVGQWSSLAVRPVPSQSSGPPGYEEPYNWSNVTYHNEIEGL